MFIVNFNRKSIATDVHVSIMVTVEPLEFNVAQF